MLKGHVRTIANVFILSTSLSHFWHKPLTIVFVFCRLTKSLPFPQAESRRCHGAGSSLGMYESRPGWPGLLPSGPWRAWPTGSFSLSAELLRKPPPWWQLQRTEETEVTVLNTLMSRIFVCKHKIRIFSALSATPWQSFSPTATMSSKS